MKVLDWEKAFDGIDHECLSEVLSRMNIDVHVIRVLRDGYEKATLFTKDQFGTSDRKQQRSGIRQGCPLSP